MKVMSLDLVREAEKRNLKNRILVTRLRYLGDVIITTPVIQALSERYPGAEIYYLTESKYASILQQNPYLNGIISLDKGLTGTLKTIREIRKKGFVAALDLFYNPRSTNILFLSGVPIRLGGNRRARKIFYTHNFKVPPETRSCVQHHLSGLGKFDCNPRMNELPRVYLNDDEKKRGKKIVEDITGDSSDRKMIVAIHPCGTFQSKRWPVESFALLADMILESFNAEIVVVSGPGQEKIPRQINALSKFDLKILPLFQIRTLASVLNFCDAVVANDGGILHLAVALGKPTIGVFGPTEPDIWFPYEDKGPFTLATESLECAPCHKDYCEGLECLRNLDPGKVFNKFLDAVDWGMSS
jgi:lipopolysaccharide heptosyltransferase II